MCVNEKPLSSNDIMYQPHFKFKISVIIIQIFLICLPAALPIFSAAGEQKQNALADLKAGNHIALVRHALAPGTGDPENFMLGDCSTQRNLSETGRKQAAAIGMQFRAAGITAAEIYTSQWCRCRETAELMGLGKPLELPALNSFFRKYERRDQQNAQLRQWLSGKDLSKPVVLVTHQVNITAFSGVYPASGEIILMRKTASGGFELASRIATD